MPLINIEYDGEHVTREEALELSEKMQELVSKHTGIEDVFVYANNSEVRVKVAAIEVFIRMKITIFNENKDLVDRMREEIMDWKKLNEFGHLINITLIPMDWIVEIGL